MRELILEGPLIRKRRVKKLILIGVDTCLIINQEASRQEIDFNRGGHLFNYRLLLISHTVSLLHGRKFCE